MPCSRQKSNKVNRMVTVATYFRVRDEQRFRLKYFLNYFLCHYDWKREEFCSIFTLSNMFRHFLTILDYSRTLTFVLPSDLCPLPSKWKTAKMRRKGIIKSLALLQASLHLKVSELFLFSVSRCTGMCWTPAWVFPRKQLRRTWCIITIFFVTIFNHFHSNKMGQKSTAPFFFLISKEYSGICSKLDCLLHPVQHSNVQET